MKTPGLLSCLLISLFTYSQPVIQPAGPTGFCVGDDVILTVSKASAGSTFQWTKDSVNITGANNINYTVSTAGNYSVIVTTAAGFILPINEVVVSAYSSPLAGFTFNNDNTCSGNLIQFTSSVASGTAPFTYSWEFGDGNVSTDQNPLHIYDTVGCGSIVLNAKLTVTDTNGCTNVVTKPITIKLAPNLQLADTDIFSPFSNCDKNPTSAGPNYSLTVLNISPGAACINSYSLDWGDGSPIESNPSFPLTHIYKQLGSFNLVFSGIGINGCSHSKTYIIANQSNPAGGLGTLGSTIGLCAPATVPFIISNWENNSPGTKYILNFGDGTSVTIDHPLASNTINHTFTKSSCPDSFTYTVRLLVTNGCASTPFTAGAIEVRNKSISQFTAPDFACVNKSVSFVSTSSTGYSGSSCGSATQWTWDFGDGSAVSHLQNPFHTYSVPGNYTVTFTSENPCDITSIKKDICIMGPATSSFTLDKVEGCIPLNVIATNKSTNGANCAPATYLWTVAYTPAYCGTVPFWRFNNSTTSASVDPSFLFTNPGSYTITLAVTNSCGTVTSNSTVLIKQPPVITLPSIPDVCASVIITPTATVGSCGNGTVSYLWTFNGGIPSTSSSINPGPVTFSTPGTNSITLAVTSECGTTTRTSTFTIFPAPDLVVPGNAIYCNGKTTAPFTSTSSTTGTSFTWTNDNPGIGLGSSGSGATIASFLTKNGSQNPITATITVKALGVNTCTQTQSFTVTVNPTPSKPIAAGSVIYCLNENALSLSATPSTGNNLTWYTSNQLVNGSNIAPIPSTNSAGITAYYVTQTNSFSCESDTTRIIVTVNPKIVNNTISADQLICNGSNANPLIPVGVISGGSNVYSYQWQSTINGGSTWSNILNTGSASFNPGAITASMQYRRIVNSSSCADTSNNITIIVQAALINTGITGIQTICIGNTPNLLIGQESSSGNAAISYKWESSPDNTNWTIIPGATIQDYAPPALSVTTYYRRKAVSDPCSQYSPSLKITVNPKPVITAVTDQYLCNSSPSGIIAFTGTPPGSTYLWFNNNTQIGLAASGTGNIASFTTANGTNAKVPITGIVKVVNANVSNSLGCAGDTMAFKIVVMPVVSITAIPDEIKCAGITVPAVVPLPDTASFVGASIQYSWTVSGKGISLVNGSGAEIPSYVTVNNGTTDVIATITVTVLYRLNGKECSGAPESYNITVKAPAAAAYAGADMILCNAFTATLSANNVIGTTGIWSQAGTDATITSPALTTTQVTNLQPGVYKFVWTQSGFGTCPGTFDTVIIDNKAALVNKIDTATKTICAGVNITITGQLPSGGSGTYFYQWQQSNDGSNFVNIPGATSQNTSFAPTSSVWLRRFVNASPCNSYSDTAQIKIQTAIANNTINSIAPICSGATAQTIIGSQPTGGDNLFIYSWEQSLNSGSSWAVITGASALNYSPGVVLQTTIFRRIVETTLCNNTAGSVSNTVTLTVTPKITNNTISTSQAICNGTVAQPLTGLNPGGGASIYLFQWQRSAANGVVWSNIANANSAIFSPGVITDTTQYRRLVVSQSCSDTSNIVTITVQASLTNFDITGAQTICAGTLPEGIIGQLPVSGTIPVTYQWESSTDNINWASITGETSQNYSPPALTITTYFRRQVKSKLCGATSQSVEITVNKRPVITPVNDVYVCNNAPLIIHFTVNPASSSYAWTNDNIQTGLAVNGNGDITFTTSNNSNPKIPIFSRVKVVATFTNNSIGCLGDTTAFNITVLPIITLSAIPNEIKCSGVTIPELTPLPDTGSLAATSILYSWVVFGKGISLANGSGSQIPAYTTLNNGPADLMATITVTPKYSYNGKTCDGLSTSYTVTVKATTAAANAGTDMILCNAATTTVSASLVNGTTGIWTQLGTDATIVSPTSATTAITDLQPDVIYQFVWTQTGFAGCPSTSDAVYINNKPALVNKIDTATVTICTGASVSVSAQLPTGGGGKFTYQWQQSTDNINYTNISGATLQNISITPSSSVWLRRNVDAPPCNNYSDTVHIIVQPALVNNTISADATICTGTTAPTIIGSQPLGSNGLITFVWEQSLSGSATWTIISGAASFNYSPGSLFQTTSFRRKMSTSSCYGLFASVSNIVTVTVNPDAKAQFTSTDVIKCAPFAITPAIINLQQSPSNNQYLWYANGSSIGSVASFPGYTIIDGNDSVIIKLVAISAYGCKNDSISQKFYTYKTANPSFTLPETIVCGPIAVQAVNTSAFVNEFTYLWDFGNGQTSTQVQPSPIQFGANPNYSDTIYTVKLTVFSTCETLSFSSKLKVKSKPKALFSPSATVGCSPMTVTFQNTSRGNNITYLWNFGDGTTLTTTSTNQVQHTYITGVVDTFFVSLKAANECGADSLRYSIIVSPNSIKLNVSVNGTDQSGCTPHSVAFINNSGGASLFRWNFGDGATTSTTKGVDTVFHTYLTPGIFTVSLQALNNCSDTTTTLTITAYSKPDAAFTINKPNLCKGDTARFNSVPDVTSDYLWKFGDGNTSSLPNPTHVYNAAGTYTVTLTASRNNSSGNVCTDISRQQIVIAATLTGSFTISDTVGNCTPFTVSFSNQIRPATTAVWNFGDNTTATGDSVVHTFLTANSFNVVLSVTVPGGCAYIAKKTINVTGPTGTLSYTKGFTCLQNAVRLQATATGATTYLWNFGDNITQTTSQQVVFHTYANPGLYVPSVTLQNATGCQFLLKGTDTIKVDKIEAGFTISRQQFCDFSILNFRDTSHVFFGKTSISWDFGDGTFGTGPAPSHTYTATGNYSIKMAVLSNSGCTETVEQLVNIAVNNKPILSIDAPGKGCVGAATSFSSVVQSVDAINRTEWTVSDGATGTGHTFDHIFNAAGTYTIQLISGTVNGCYDTANHTILVNPTPSVTASPSLTLCSGISTQLTATGTLTYQWLPLQGLSCYTCASPVASPTNSTLYEVEGKNSFGCSAYDTVRITVMQPLHLNIAPNDSICIGQSTNLLVSGASSYNWSPSQGLNNTNTSNPIASPTITTIYRVVGYDGFDCFTDTAFVTVAVGKYPTVNLGPDLTLATGTLHPLTSVVTNGPISKWLWTPNTSLTCNGCAIPIAEIKKNISYSVVATNAYGCPSSDTINIKVFCDASQVFIPNAFTPDNDGLNDVLMVRGKGIVQVKFFRIFNRWGDLIFEKDNFAPNNPSYGWNGTVKGQTVGPDVFIYTCEAICENGSVFSFKGNVTLIK
ncbi:MAG: PKD domain-containing protein [Chitinophagaceae bacterium]